MAAPTKPDSPDKLPKAPAVIDTSAKAYPIPVKPSLMSSHAILPISLKAFAISSRDCTAINIDTAPIIPDKPAILPRAPTAIESSAKA